MTVEKFLEKVIKMKNRLRRFWGFYSLDYKAMEKYIEYMAEEGWIIEKVSRFIATFRKVEPQKIKCYIDIFPKSKNTTTESLNEYRDFCEDSGWTYATEYDCFQFYYAPNRKDPTPIQTDKEIEQKIVESTVLKREISGSLTFFTFVGMYSFIGMYDFNYKMLYNFTSTTLLLVLPIIIAIMFIQSIYLIKIRTNLKNGISTPNSNLKHAKVRRFWFSLIPIMLAIFTLVSMIFDAVGSTIYVFVLVPVIVGGLFGLVYNKWISKSSRKIKVIYFITLFFFIITVSFITLFCIILEVNETEVFEISDYPVMELKDFSEVNTITHSNSINNGFSLIVPKNYIYAEYKEGGVSIRTKYTKAVNSYFAEIIFNGMLDDELRGNDQQIDANNYWNIDEAVFIGDKDRILLRSGSVVVYIEGGFDFSAENTINVIKRKLGIE